MKDQFQFTFKPVLNSKIGKRNRINLKFERFTFFFNMEFDKWFFWNLLKVSFDFAFDRTQRTFFPVRLATDEHYDECISADIFYYGFNASINILAFRIHIEITPFRRIKYNLREKLPVKQTGDLLAPDL